MKASAMLAALVGMMVLIARAEAQETAVAKPQAESQSRSDHLLFSIPTGWKRQEDDKYTMLVPAELPQGKQVEIRLWPAKALSGTLDAAANAELETLKTTYTQVQTMPLNPIRHAGGFDMIMTGASMSVAGSGQFVYDAICLVHAGEQVQKIEFQVNDFQLYQSQQVTFNQFLHGMRVSDSLVLAEGTPPLTQAKVDEVTDFLEWLIDVPFTGEQRQMIAQNLIDSWKKNDREDINGVEDVFKLRTQLSEMTKEQKELARQAAQPELIKAARKESDAVAKMIVQVYDAAHQPIAPGDPPLTRQGTDALLETLFFMASQVQGGAEVKPTQDMKEQWAKALAGSYDKADESARKELAEMPMRWAAMRMMWPGMSDEDKAKTKAQWAQSPQVQQVAAVVAKMSQQPAASGEGYFAEGKNVVHQNGGVRYVVFNMNSEKEAQDRAVEMNKGRDTLINGKSPDNAADAIAKHNQDYETTRSLLNTSMSCYQMQMSAISGVGSAGWHYQYR